MNFDPETFYAFVSRDLAKGNFDREARVLYLPSAMEYLAITVLDGEPTAWLALRMTSPPKLRAFLYNEEHGAKVIQKLGGEVVTIKNWRDGPCHYWEREMELLPAWEPPGTAGPGA